MSRKHNRQGQQSGSIIVPSQPHEEGNPPPAGPGQTSPAMPTRMNGPGVIVVPAELMAQMQRRWALFVALAGCCMVLAVCAIVGWVMYIRASNSLTDVGTRATTAGANLQDLRDNLAKAESRANAAEANAQSRMAAVEQARKEADGKREVAEKALVDAEARLKAAEQAKISVEEKLKVAETAQATAETARSTAEKATAAAETKLAQLQQSATGLQDTVRRTQMDANLYRREMQSARDGERRAVQKLQDVLGEMVLADRRSPALTPGNAASPTVALSAPATAQPVEQTPPTPAVVSDIKKPDLAATQPAVADSTSGEAEAQTLIPIRKENTLTRIEKPQEQLDPAVEAASPEKLLPWGEAMIVAGYPERGVTLLRKAIEKGASGPEYHKSLGWALLRLGQPNEAKKALEAALVGFEDWSATSAKASPDHWTAAFLLGRVKEEDFIRRWARDEKFEGRLACLPWFYAGQSREIEGRRDEAMSAYRVSVELGQTPNSYPIWRWAEQRLRDLEKAPPATRPAQLNSRDE